MFKKLKDKIAEEVKSSPQRVQQLAQGVQAVVQAASGPQVNSEDGLSLTNSPDKDDSFSNISLQNTSSPKRRNSNSSMASDVSFLPAFEAHANLYHLQVFYLHKIYIVLIEIVLFYSLIWKHPQVRLKTHIVVS